MSKGSSTSKLQKPLLLSSSLSLSSLHKTHSKLPHRYVQNIKIQKQDRHQIFASIEANTCLKFYHKPKQLSQGKNIKQKQLIISSNMVLQKKIGFKSQPLNKAKNCKIKFDEIFINHRQQTLNVLKQSIVENGKKISKLQTNKHQQSDNNSSPSKQLTTQKKKKNDQHFNYKQMIQLLQEENLQEVNTQNQKQLNFYDYQIPIQLSNTQNAIMRTSGIKNTEILSLPLNDKNNKDLNFNELMLRAKAGIFTENIQRQSHIHMTFLLGELCIEKGKYKKGLKFFNRYLTSAKIMEDRVGMNVGANRVGIAYYYCKNFEKSIAFHNQNLKLSENEQCFIGLYNIGICYRKLKKPQIALQYFQNALNCCHLSQKLDSSSSCTVLGQIAITYETMQLFQQALQKLQQTILTCSKIKNNELKLTNYLHLLRISSLFKLKSKEQLIQIALLTFSCAKELEKNSILDLLRTNIGILKGLCQIQCCQCSNKINYQIEEIAQ